MSELALPQGSTLRSIAETLAEEYVRAVLVNVNACHREMGSAVVALSLTGDKRFPDYNVGPSIDTDTTETTARRCFSGKTHKPLRPDRETRTSWSCERMTWRELSVLIGEIRGYKAAKRKAPRS